MALSTFSASLLTVAIWPSSSHASGRTDAVEFQVGVTTLVAEGGALPVAHLGLRAPLGSLANLVLRLDTLGIAGALQTSFDLPVVRSENGLHGLGLRATAAVAYAADVFGGTPLVGMPMAGFAGSVGSNDLRATFSVEAGMAISGFVARAAGSRVVEPEGFVLRPELSVEFFADEVVRPFVGASGIINPDLVFGTATLGLRW